ARTANIVDAPFAWKPGIRVGMGMVLQDDFDVKFSYTNFNTTATNQAAGEVYSGFLGNFYVDNSDGTQFGPHYGSANINWDFSFQNFDLEIGRTSSIGSALLRPFVGIKGAIIKQAIRSRWRDPIDTLDPLKIYTFTTASENLEQDYWGIGPSFGVEATVPIYTGSDYSLQLFAAPSGALMYGHWQFSDHYENDESTTVDINLSPIDGLSTMLRGMIGIEWTQHFSRITTSVRLKYETQIWLNQMQFYSLSMGRLNNLMSLQGGVLDVAIHY
ncbi:MAG: Lpg1974 family pore-forming outer membrane protein, partial [Planctomycetales bacterium]